MIHFPEVRDTVFIGALLVAFAFYSIRQSDTNTLLTIIIMGGVSWVAYMYTQKQSETIEKTRANVDGRLDDEAKWQEGRISETHADAASIPPFPKKGFKYLKTNSILVDIATDLILIHMFDRSRYGDLCHLMNTYQKTYQYNGAHQ